MEEQSKKEIKRVLFLADFCCASGFAQVAHNIVKQLLKEDRITYQIDVVGINYYGIPSDWQDFHPQVRVFPASVISGGDVFGRNGMLQMLAQGAYDLLFTLQDTFIIEPIADQILDIRNQLYAAGGKPFKWIYYFPIDAHPMENWVTKSVSKADVPVVYTKYGYDECLAYDESLKDKLKVVPHGVDHTIFKPEDPELVKKFRKNYWVGNADDKFLVTNVNRNQLRKDIPRTMQIFAMLKKQVPEAVLYLHMKKNDVGWNIDEVARHFSLIPDKDYIAPASFSEHDGVEIQVMSFIYNASDVVMTTSLGEGWGLSLTEAMACKCPVVAPNHTSITEILGDGRGTLVEAGRTSSEWYAAPNDNNRLRPLANVPDFVNKLAWVRNNKEQAKAMSENAYNHLLKNWTWEIVGSQWREIFFTAIPSQEKRVKIGRNDPCFCGSGKKYKHCHLNNNEQ